jgi:hypothetical protein
MPDILRPDVDPHHVPYRLGPLTGLVIPHSNFALQLKVATPSRLSPLTREDLHRQSYKMVRL